MTRNFTYLGIESSCDDTAAAVVRGNARDAKPGKILSSVVFGQNDLHADFGGVVPEIAARAHAERLDICIEQAMRDAGVAFSALDGIAVTAGPGLIGGVLAGVSCAKAIASASNLPIHGVNHLAGHALTPRLTDGLDFPYLMLLVSGGHCQLLQVDGPNRFQRLGGSIDDAPGEVFDKIARLLGLGYPGGPLLEAVAKAGDGGRFRFPRSLLDVPGCDLSFSGLKTAVRRQIDSFGGGMSAQDRSDIAAAFQAAVADVLAEKAGRAMSLSTDASVIAVAGGVAANQTIRSALRAKAAASGFGFIAPPLQLCTDNGAIIAWAGIERAAAGIAPSHWFSARPRWPLDEQAAPLFGSGKKGAKA